MSADGNPLLSAVLPLPFDRIRAERSGVTAWATRIDKALPTY